MKYFLKEAHTPPNPNISPVPRHIILNAFEHIIAVALPAVFDFLKILHKKNKSYKNIPLSTDLLVKMINEKVVDFRNDIDQNKNHVILDHDMENYILPKAKEYIEELVKLGLILNLDATYIEYTLETNQENLLSDKDITDARGHTEYPQYFEYNRSLKGDIVINIQDLITLKFYNVYIKYGVNGLVNEILNDKKLVNEYLSTIRHEAQHAYQIYNSCIFNFYDYVIKQNKQGINLTPAKIEEIFWDEIVGDPVRKRGNSFTYFKKGSLNKMRDVTGDNVNIEDEEKRNYYYDSTEAPTRLNDFVIGFTHACKNYLNDSNEIIELLFHLLDSKAGNILLKVKEGEINYITDIGEMINSLFEFIPVDEAYDIAYDLVENVEVMYNFPFIEDIMNHGDPKLKKYYTNKLKSKIQKEFVRPSL